MLRFVVSPLVALLAATLLATPARAQSQHLDAPPPITATNSAQAPQTSDADPQARLDIRQGVVRARAFLGLHDYRNARAEVAIILASHPDEVGALRTRASIEEATGRWRQAAVDWARVATLTADPAAAARRDALVRAHPSYAGLTGFFEGSSGADEMSGVRLTFARRPLDAPEWTAALEHRSAHADQATRLDGSIGPIETSRRKLDVEVADTLVAGRVGLRLVATDDTLGAGASFRRLRPWGFVEASAMYHDPYWPYAAALASDATSDHVDFGADVTRGRWSVRGRIGVATYAVDGEDDVARSTRGALAMEYAFGDRTAPAPWRLTLALDREAFFAVKRRPGPGGAPFAPIDVADRFILSAGTAKTFGDPDRRHSTIAFGYRRDTENDTQGPYGFILTETPIGSNVRLGLRAEYSDVATRGVSTQPYGFAEIYLRRTF
ncbi:MAG: hypothetical protein KJS97_00070 [Alphaproteobacteria bacterium]|nr:hypothetical protein [Alphaproteobacteria bacterium]